MSMIQIITGSILVVIGIYVFYTYPIKSDTKSLTLAALLIVITVILKRLTIMVPLFGAESLKIGFSVIPIMLSGMLLTPGYCYVVGIAVDLVGLIIVPTGFPFLGFTLNCVLEALIPALLMQKIKTKQHDKIEVILKIGLISLVVLASSYLFSIDTVTISTQVVTITLWHKLCIIGSCTILIILLFMFLSKMKKQIDSVQRKTFNTWVVAVIVVEICISFLLTPFWLQEMYQIPFMMSLFVRVIKSCIMIPLDIVIGYNILKALKKLGFQNTLG